MAELLRKQPVPIRIPSCEEADTDGFVHELLGPPHQRAIRPGKARTVAKLAGIATGALVLCASVTVASLTTRNRPAVDISARLTRPAEITGANALLPGFLNQHLGAPAPTGSAAANANARPGGPAATRAPEAGGTAEATPLSSVQMAADAEPTDLVREFYRLLDDRPRDALALIDTRSLTLDPVEFVQSWSAVRDIDVARLENRENGTVHAVVTLRQRDGHWLRLEELFHTTNLPSLRISDATVLSAERH
ncbi:hypothetical protein [Goodfellowiella coeruleoviolacea]|uniref:hypothetical protein n=1 Tax=Goodfellowiella coeruleoviolacea TaxID=334858 RepID=UPI0020A597D3|nr:hypothetical protein [Goodfellowiella coeruleoviolacea]